MAIALTFRACWFGLYGAPGHPATRALCPGWCAGRCKTARSVAAGCGKEGAAVVLVLGVPTAQRWEPHETVHPDAMCQTRMGSQDTSPVWADGDHVRSGGTRTFWRPHPIRQHGSHSWMTSHLSAVALVALSPWLFSCFRAVLSSLHSAEHWLREVMEPIMCQTPGWPREEARECR